MNKQLLQKKEKKHKRKLLTIPIWQIEELEAWLTDMSLQGWQLIRINKLYLTFEEMEASSIHYRCELFKINNPAEDERIELYRNAGWEHVGSRDYVQIFRQIEPGTSLEIHTDPLEQAETLTSFQKSIFKRGMLILFLTFIIILTQLLSLHINPVDNYLSDRYLQAALFIIIYIWIALSMLLGIIHLRKLRKKLEKGELLNHQIPYKKKVYLQNSIGIGMIFLAALFLLSNVHNIYQLIAEERYPEVPNEALPILQLADLVEEETYIKSKRIEQGTPINRFSERSSYLVPKQYSLNEAIEPAQEHGEQQFGQYQLWSEGYQLRHTWLTPKFFSALKEKHLFILDDWHRVDDSPFDEMWLSTKEYHTSILATYQNQVFFIRYTGNTPVSKIVEEMYAKIKN